MSILVTGGAGFIGSHTAVELLNAGEDIIIADNYWNSKPKSIKAIKKLTGKDFKFYETDLTDYAATESIFAENDIEAVIHFAGYKAVGESVLNPLMYYKNNLGCTFSLLEAMKKHHCKKFVFSSSATVYGIPQNVPVDEDAPLSVINPYGSTKLIIENLCREISTTDSHFSFVLLRYFNPIGAHESGLIGEDPNGVPNNLMPIILKVAKGKIANLSLYGNDYDTPDGTCIRDYIHVVDLAKGHIAALQKARDDTGVFTYNLGTGRGYSVLDIINTFEKVNNVKVPYVITTRRLGDAAMCYSDPNKAKIELNWVAEKQLEDMCKDAWNFAVKN